MDFNRKKLPTEAAATLRLCPIASVQAFAPMLAPVYVYLKMNQKFVSVKAPLDFFTPEELARLSTYETFYLSESVETALLFRQCARQVRALISWTPEHGGVNQLPPAPYEISDAVLRIIGPLWGSKSAIEPFFAAVFAGELCDLLPGELMLAAREKDIVGYERAILRSSWAVFLALHLGYCDLSFLNSLRRRVFEECMAGFNPVRIGKGSDVVELLQVAFETVELSGLTRIDSEIFKYSQARSALKLVTRLERIKKQMLKPDMPDATIFGEKGFADG